MTDPDCHDEALPQGAADRPRSFRSRTSLRTPGSKLALVIGITVFLSIPLFVVWMLIANRHEESTVATQSIAAGWGGAQLVSGPLLVVPYRGDVQGTDGWPAPEWRTLSPERVEIATEVSPERRVRSIYEAIVYQAALHGRARFVLPPDLASYGIDPARLDLAHAELRFGLADPRGLGANPRVSVGGRALRLQPGRGTGATRGAGFFAWLDAGGLASGGIDVAFNFDFRGNRTVALAPEAGDLLWHVRSAWPSPSFQGSFLPDAQAVGASGFDASYRVGNLALGQPLISTGAAELPAGAQADANGDPHVPAAQIDLIQPIDIYSQIDRSAKYGFLIIGFTFLALLMFDVIGGAGVSATQYFLVGVALILFFVLLLAFAEVIGFTLAYGVAAASVAGLNTAYTKAVLGSWRRAGSVGALLAGLYAVLYVLLSLEDLALMIGAVLLFAALAAIMYLTRNIDWGGKDTERELVPAH